LYIASIGAGGQAAGDIQRCASENIVALADPDSVSAANMFNRFPNAPRYTDFRKMLDKEAKGQRPDPRGPFCPAPGVWGLRQGKEVNPHANTRHLHFVLLAYKRRPRPEAPGY
jgi:hypothetical protein